MTEKDKIRIAKQYLNEVIDQIVNANSDIKQVINNNIELLIDVSLQYSYLGKSFELSSTQELNRISLEVFNQIESDIFNVIKNRAYNVESVAYKKNKSSQIDETLIAVFLASKIADKTLNQRINQYVLNMKSEIEAYISAGIHNGMNRTQILSTYLANINKPFASSLMLNTFKENGFKAERIASKGVSFGTGKYISSFNNIKRLEQDMIFRSYNYINQSIWMLDRNYIGWYTIRGSNYPCSLCDNQTGVFHSRNESFSGYHNRCYCLQIPVYLNEI